MELQEIIATYQRCPYVHMSISQPCDNCPLADGLLLVDIEDGTQIKTTVCRILEALEQAIRVS